MLSGKEPPLQVQGSGFDPQHHPHAESESESKGETTSSQGPQHVCELGAEHLSEQDDTRHHNHGKTMRRNEGRRR